MKIEITPWKVKEQDIDRAEQLLGSAGFRYRPRTPCTSRTLRKSLQPEFAEALERIDMLRNPEKYFPQQHAKEIKRLARLSRKDQYCQENHLYDDLVTRKLTGDFYGDSLEREGGSNSVAPGLAGYLVTAAIVNHRKRSSALRQIRTLPKKDLHDYLGFCE